MLAEIPGWTQIDHDPSPFGSQDWATVFWVTTASDYVISLPENCLQPLDLAKTIGEPRER